MSQDPHTRHEENIPAYLLGALPELERTALEQHLASCDACRVQVERLRPAADSLGRAVRPLAPPPRLKAALMAEVESERRVASPARPRRRFGFESTRLRPALAGGLAAGLLALGVAGGYGVSQLGEGGRTIAADVDAGRLASARGELIVPDEGRAVLQLSGLPQLEDGRTYQLWLLKDGRVRSESLFSVDRRGHASAAVSDALDGADAVMVTREVAGGADAPTEKPIVTVRL